MKIVEIISGIFLLIFVYLLLSAPSAVSQIFQALSTYGSGAIGTLQGRTVQFPSGVSVGTSTLGQGLPTIQAPSGY